MKKYIELLSIGFALFIFGIIAFAFETHNYNYNQTLPIELEKDNITVNFNIEKDKKYVIQKAKYNKNINIVKHIDNTLNNEMLVIGSYYETSQLLYNYNVYGDDVRITFYNELKLKTGDISKIYNIFLRFVFDKTVYNYNLLKYSNIDIYVNEENSKNIEILDSNNKEYVE